LAKEKLTREEVNKMLLATDNEEKRSFMWQQSCLYQRNF